MPHDLMDGNNGGTVHDMHRVGTALHRVYIQSVLIAPDCTTQGIRPAFFTT